MTYHDYLRESALDIQRLSQRVRRRMWLPRLLRKIAGMFG